MEAWYQILSISEIQGKPHIYIYLDSAPQKQTPLTIHWCFYC